MAIFATALLAAVSAHVSIDILGDYLVRDDSYDHVAHGSRLLFTVIALGLGAVTGIHLFLRLCRAAASLRLRARMLHLRLGQIAGAVAIIALLALLIVPAMETLDALRAGSNVDSIADAFGGSLLLGISTTLSCALVWSGVIVALAAWLLRHRERVVQLFFELLGVRRRREQRTHERLAPGTVIANSPARLAKRCSKRGPPAPAALPIPVY